MLWLHWCGGLELLIGRLIAQMTEREAGARTEPCPLNLWVHRWTMVSLVLFITDLFDLAGHVVRIRSIHHDLILIQLLRNQAPTLRHLLFADALASLGIPVVTRHCDASLILWSQSRGDHWSRPGITATRKGLRLHL